MKSDSLKSYYSALIRKYPFLKNFIDKNNNCDLSSDELQDKIIVLPHPLMLEALTNSDSHLKKLLIDKTYDDVLKECKLLITDYSSVIFDYVLMNKPIIYFTYDYKDYVENGRGLYFPFEEYVYGTVTENSDELIKAIENPKMEEEKRLKFIEKFMRACDGNSTQKVVDWIFK